MKKNQYQPIIYIFLVLISILGTYFWLYYNSSEFNFDYVDPITQIEIPENIQSQIIAQYDPSREDVFCMLGYRQGNSVIITGYETTQVIKRSEGEIIFYSCSSLNNLGIVHSQPENVCDLSREDSYVFGKTNDLIMGVMCGTENIIFYTPWQLNTGFTANVK